MRIVVVGIGPTEACERLRPFEGAYQRVHASVAAVKDPARVASLSPGHLVVIVPLEIAGEQALGVVRRARTDVTVVASVDRFTRRAILRSLKAGADALVSWEQPPDEAVETVWAATRGFVRRSVVTPLLPMYRDGLEDEERRWLGLLAAGYSINAVAEDAGRSLSDLKRRLHALYQRLGVKGTRAALLVAQREGWLDEVTPQLRCSRHSSER